LKAPKGLIINGKAPVMPHRGPFPLYFNLSLTQDCRLMFNRNHWRRQPDSNRCITVLQTVALPLGYAASKSAENRNGAGNGIRTRDFNLGKVALYR
jgi:hypothetical protein